MKYKTVKIEGCWKDSPKESHEYVVAIGKWDGIEDEYDNGIFYYSEEMPQVGDQMSEFIVRKVME